MESPDEGFGSAVRRASSTFLTVLAMLMTLGFTAVFVYSVFSGAKELASLTRHLLFDYDYDKVLMGVLGFYAQALGLYVAGGLAKYFVEDQTKVPGTLAKRRPLGSIGRGFFYTTGVVSVIISAYVLAKFFSRPRSFAFIAVALLPPVLIGIRKGLRDVPEPPKVAGSSETRLFQ